MFNEYEISSAFKARFGKDASENTLIEALKNNKLTFQEIAALCKKLKDSNRKTMLDSFLADGCFFNQLINQNLISKKDVKYLLEKITKPHELKGLCENTPLVKYLIEQNIYNFQKFIDRCEKHHMQKNFWGQLELGILENLLKNESLFKELINNSLVNNEDLQYMLSNIDHWWEIDSLVNNHFLMKKLCENNLFELELLGQLEKILFKQHYLGTDSSNFFDYTEFRAQNHMYLRSSADGSFRKKDTSQIDHNFLEFIKTYKKLYKLSLNEKQLNEMFEITQNFELARDRLMHIVSNNLENNFSFDDLIQYLKKPEKKTLLNI